MSQESQPEASARIVKWLGEIPRFKPGDRVRVLARSPIGHYRVPIYVRGRCGLVEKVIQPTTVNNEEEGFGRNAGSRGHYYRVVIPLSVLWPGYAGSATDDLRIEIFETWLEGV